MLKRNIIKIFPVIVIAFALSSCFTGIESTKKINMSREDRKRSAPGPEEIFFSGIEATPLKDWEQGREFIASDDKALLIFDTYMRTLHPDTSSIKGKTIRFEGVQSRMGAAGNLNLLINFTDGNRNFFYDTGKDFDSAMENVESDDIPTLIDKEMVAQAARLLIGKNLWTRSNLWYNQNDDRIDGKKFVEVTIEDVEAGNMIFPLRLKLKDMEGDEFYMYMNFGNSDTESRAFHNLFSLSDIKKQYPGIDPEVWKYITLGKVTLGMTKQECRLSLGNPIDVASGHDYSQTLDIWTYDNGKILWFEDGKLVRYKG